MSYGAYYELTDKEVREREAEYRSRLEKEAIVLGLAEDAAQADHERRTLIMNNKNPKPTPETIQNLIRVIKDHPRPGVLYQDMASLFNAPNGLRNVMALFNDYIVDNNIFYDKIVGLDARGFPMAGALSASTGIPFSMARKKGKLPGKTIHIEYELEYGTDELHLQLDAISSNDRVLIIDDVIATGGTLEAVISLINGSGGEVVGILSIMELEWLGGGHELRDSGYDVYSILQEK